MKPLIADMYWLKMYLFINLEFSLFVNMLVRIWKAHAIACMTQQSDYEMVLSGKI